MRLSRAGGSRYLLLQRSRTTRGEPRLHRRNTWHRVEAPEGSIELVDADGHKYDLTGKPNFALCRCGGSVNKPFCDGTHSRIGFQAAEAAVRAEEQGKDQQKKP